MTDFITLTEYIFSDPLIMGVIAIAHGLILLFFIRKQRQFSAASRFVDEQYVVVIQESLDRLRAELDPTKRQVWDECIARVRMTPDGVVRRSHLFAISGVLEGDFEPASVERLRVPAQRPYRAAEDLGIEHYLSFNRAMLKGEQVRAYAELKTGVDKGSPICMTAYGDALIDGRVPGREPAPSDGIALLQAAIERSGGICGSLALGWVILKGQFLEQDVQRAQDLFEQSQETQADAMRTLEIAEVFRKGLHNIAANPNWALYWALKNAPAWRQLLQRLGVSQLPWLDDQLAKLDSARRQAQALTPTQRARLIGEVEDLFNPQKK